jgi:hypothetical protein
MQQQKPTMSRRTHLVPTHINTPETLLTLAGVSLSVRQFLLLLVGISLTYRLWLTLPFLALLPAGQFVRGVVAALPLCGTLAFAFVSKASRTLDSWCVVAMRYALRPRQFIWRSIRFHEPGWGDTIPEEEDHGDIHS